MRVVFMGTSGFAVPILSALSTHHNVVAVVSQPDRPSGRGLHASESPIKQEAVRSGLPIYQPERVRHEDFVEQLQALGPLDAIVVAAFGQIIPKVILDMPRLGCVNVHASLLPKYRGAAPIHYAILNGETRTGITTMLMDPGLDTGPILLQEETEIGAEETTGELGRRLSDVGAKLLLCTLEGLEQGTVTPLPQDASLATVAPSIKKEQTAVDWNQPAVDIVNKIRAFTPRPGVFAFLRGGSVRLWTAQVVPNADGGPAATILEVRHEGVSIAAGSDAVLLTEVQPENRKRMAASEFAHGARLKAGDKFE